GRTWLAPGGGNKVYLSAKETTQALYRAYVTEIEVIRLQRLAPLMGGEARASGPATPLLPHSGLGLPFILAAIEGERDLLGNSGFLADDLASTDKERSAIAVLGSVATDLGFALRAGEAAAAMAPNALADEKARERLAPMLLSLKNAEDTGRAALGDLTGQTLGFNSLDGDRGGADQSAFAAVFFARNLPDMSTTGCVSAPVGIRITSLASRSKRLRSTMRIV